METSTRKDIQPKSICSCKTNLPSVNCCFQANCSFIVDLLPVSELLKELSIHFCFENKFNQLSSSMIEQTQFLCHIAGYVDFLWDVLRLCIASSALLERLTAKAGVSKMGNFFFHFWVEFWAWSQFFFYDFFLIFFWKKHQKWPCKLLGGFWVHGGPAGSQVRKGSLISERR